ncbi:hypothetical protein RJ639_028780 [Escallonia herrerae]|uniref:Ty3 transposon capsid-like protein domain-containing protein n=1 Tax=Escallonia herrerae TaxID=1293975 RepID=A0AA88XDV4_9ASTE|nr:hypothetical protein RJ639_028780 [Escallonia herrerae]
MREARQVDNFFWYLERYFEALDIDEEEKVQRTIISQVELIFNRLDDLEVDSRLTMLERKVNVFAEELDDLIEERVPHFTKWERYFEALNIDEEEEKVQKTVMYLIVKTWEKFKHELKRQFYPKSIEDMAMINLQRLRRKESIHEYVKEYSALMLIVPEMFERQRLCFFIDRLQQWVATELWWREPHNLASAMAIVKRLEDFEQCERPRSPRHERAKDKKDSGSKSGSAKAINDELSGDKGRRGHHKEEKKHEGSHKQGDSCDHKAHRGLRRECFCCAGPHCGRMDFMEKSSAMLNPYRELEWMIPLVSKDGANARKGITVLQLDEGLTLCYVE